MDYHSHEFQIYYEDTDLSEIVYHANYLKYFERAREHLLGVDELVDLYYQLGIGFVVYKAELTFKEGLDLEMLLRSAQRPTRRVNTAPSSSSLSIGVPPINCSLRASCRLVCVNGDNRLVPLPESVISRLPAS